MKPKLLLAEDYAFLRKMYVPSLISQGFSVCVTRNGNAFYEILGKRKFDLIVSDTDLPEMCGDEVCKRALEEGLIDSSVYIFAMSDCEDNQQYWRGIANVGSFYNKANLTDGRIGEKVFHGWKLFKSCGIWQAKMPVLDDF